MSLGREPSICMNFIYQMAMVRSYRYGNGLNNASVSNRMFCWQVDARVRKLPVKREVIRPGV